MRCGAAIILGLAVCFWAASALAAGPVVRAVLFYSPTCPHCHKVINEDLPPLIDRYGPQLQLVGIDVSQQQGAELYRAAVEAFQIPTHRQGVPTVVVGELVLVGSQEIPERLPGLIEDLLARGGVGWPAIPGLAEVLPPEPEAGSIEQPVLAPTTVSQESLEAAIVPASPATAAAPVPAGPLAELAHRVGRDPVGNTLAIGVMLGMALAVVAVIDGLSRGRPRALPAWGAWAIPALIVLGLSAAGYLAYVELAQTTAVCGPVGNCNAVYQSPYSRLLGRIPIGLLGVFGYLLIGAAWAVTRSSRGRLAGLAGRALVGLTLGGTLFSIYLTFLEPFVIGATCAWCLASAVIMTVLMTLSARLPSLG